MVDTIDELSALSRRLNQKSDTLNAVITSINEKLTKLNLGVEAWLSEPIEADDPYYHPDDVERKFPRREAVLLGYCRFDNAWALATKEATLGTDSDNYGNLRESILTASHVVPLLNASRIVRANAMRLIPGLLDVIKNTAEKLLKSIEEAEKSAANL